MRRDALARAAGAVLGASSSALVLGVAGWLGVGWSSFLPQVELGILAIGMGAGLGLVWGPAAVTSAQPVWFAFSAALRAVVLGVTLALGAAEVLTRLRGQSHPDAWSFLGGLLFGVPYGMVLALPVTASVALMTTAVLRLSSRRPTIGTLVIVLVAGGALVGTPVLNASRFRLPISAVGGVHLTVTIENHSHQSLGLGVWTSSGESTGGSIGGIEPCFITTETRDTAPGWFVTVQTDPEDPIPAPVISAVEAPGPDPAVGIVVAADGTVSASPRRAPPTPDELTVDLCAQSGS